MRSANLNAHLGHTVRQACSGGGRPWGGVRVPLAGNAVSERCDLCTYKQKP